MAIVYRKEKGSPLSLEEMDGNFRDLEDRLKAVEESPAAAEGIKEIKVEGEIMSIQGSHGTDFGSFKLPVYLPHNRGLWKKEQPYAIGDWVQFEKGLYGCEIPHRSEDFFTELKEKKWTQIYEGG